MSWHAVATTCLRRPATRLTGTSIQWLHQVCGEELKDIGDWLAGVLGQDPNMGP